MEIPYMVLADSIDHIIAFRLQKWWNKVWWVGEL